MAAALEPPRDLTVPREGSSTLRGLLSVLVRRRVAGAAAETRTIVPSDFAVVEERRPDALDLVALCRA